MKAIFSKACALAVATILAGCTTGGGGGANTQAGIEVLKTHLGQPVAKAQISVEPFERADANNPEFPGYAAAVAQQLSRLGWSVAPNPQSEQVALVDVQQGSRDILTQPAAAGTPRAASPAGAPVATQLSVRIKRRSEGTVFWEGRATSEAGARSDQAQRAATVQRLAEALFRDVPGESGRTIRLR